MAAGWLAKRNAQIVASQLAAEAQPQQEKPVDTLTTKPRAVRPQAAIRRGTGTARVANKSRVDTAIEAPVSDPAPVKVIETGEERIAAASDSIELVVSKSGSVERAKIFSTPPHWEDALLLSRGRPSSSFLHIEMGSRFDIAS